MKLKKILASILAICMVLSTMGTVAFAEGSTEEVSTYEELIEALAKENANVIMMDDITATATQGTSYGKAGIVVDAGDILDGNGKTLTINGANDTWDTTIGMTGGTVKNLTVAGGFRGIFMPGANGDVVIDNCIFKDVVYTFNSDAGSKDYTVTIKNSALNGWTSFSDVHKSVAFENCTFGEGCGNAFCRPYNETTFTGCEFNEGFKIDMRATQTFNECTYDDEPLGANNIKKLFVDGNDGKKVFIDNEEVTLNKQAVAYIGLTGYTDLHEVLKNAGAAGAGNTTIEIVADVDLENVAWTPVNVDGYHGADIVTINGNGHTITNLSAPLFAGGFAGGSGIVINDLTIKDSTIVSANTIGSGAFIESVDSMAKIELKNCNLLNSSVTGSRTGGLIGWTAGYNNTNDGPVKTYITIGDCSVIGCTITGSSVGAINGHAGNNAWTYTTIENCEIKDNKLISTDDGGWRVGVVVGTANVGQVAINKIEESNNTLSQGDVTAKDGQTNLVGRFVPSSKEEDKSNLVIDNVAYTTECKPYAVTVSDDNGVSGYDTFDEAAKNIGAGEVSIELSQDASLNVSDAYIKLGTTDTESITINGNKNRLDLTTTYWSRLNLANPDAKLILNDMTVDSSQESGTWNSYDVTFMCPVELNDVVFEKAVALENDATLKNVQISETHDYYALWISANGQEVSIDGLTITSAGRGIKIDDQYVSNVGKVTLGIKNATFETVKKAAIVVDSSAGAAIEAANCDISKVAADSQNLVWVDEGSAADQKKVTVNGKPAFIENQCVRLNDDMYFASIKDAIDNAQPGETITLLGNITENVVINAPAAAVFATVPSGVTIELNGFNIEGKLKVEAGAKATLSNGTMSYDSTSNTDRMFENYGNLTLDNVTVTDRNRAENFTYTVTNYDGGEMIIKNSTINGGFGGVAANGGKITLINTTSSSELYHGIYVKANAEVVVESGTYAHTTATGWAYGICVNGGKATINGGSFSGGAGGGICSMGNGEIVINNGEFTGAINATSGSVTIYGGKFDQNPSAYLAEKHVATVNAVSGLYEVSAENTKANKISVVFEENTKITSKDEDIKVYDIVLKAESDINEFASAELTFVNDSTLLAGGELPYVITPAENMTLSTVDGKPGYYGFAMNGKEYEISGTSITIGTVTFTGYGDLTFGITEGIVNATTVMNNLVKTYVVGGSVDNDVTTGKLDISGKIDGDNAAIAVPTRKLTINVTFPNGIEDIDVSEYYQDMKVVITGTFNDGLTKTVEYKLGVKGDISMIDGKYVVEDANLVLNNAYTVTISGAGYRTARYTVTMTEDKTLRFWNNVMDEAQFVEIGKDSSKVNVTFLAGDIVKDNNINIYDLSAVVSYFGSVSTTENGYAKYDLNRDGVIDSKDVAYVLVSWGK